MAKSVLGRFLSFALDSVSGPSATTATRTEVPASASSTQLLAANPTRIEAWVFNDSTSALHIGLGVDPVTLVSFSFYVPAKQEKALPLVWKGEVRGFWDTATGVARVTEVTP